MDNLTHTLFAATLARTALARAGPGTTAVLILGSNAPDADVIVTVGGALAYLDWHRGPTHGPIGVIGLGAVAGLLGWWWTIRRRGGVQRDDPAGGRPASMPVLMVLGMLGAALHVAMDLPTSYGTRVLSPFLDDWFTTDWMPIVDVYLIALLAAGLLVGRRSGARHRVALAVILLLASHYGLRAVAHEQAIALAPRAFGPRLPRPCPGVRPVSRLGRWPNTPRIPGPPGEERCLLEVAAMPTFFSPFRWQLIARTSNAYELQQVDLLEDAGIRGTRPWRLSRRVPDQWTPAVLQAAASEVGRRFLSFARFPSARSALAADGSTTVRWQDMRFVPAPASPRVSPDRRSLFRATVQVAADGRILAARLGD